MDAPAPRPACCGSVECRAPAARAFLSSGGGHTPRLYRACEYHLPELETKIWEFLSLQALPGGGPSFREISPEEALAAEVMESAEPALWGIAT